MAEITENSVPERTPRCIRRNAVLYTLGRAAVLLMALLTAADLVCVYLCVGTETAIGLMIPRMGAMLGYNGAGAPAVVCQIVAYAVFAAAVLAAVLSGRNFGWSIASLVIFSVDTLVAAWLFAASSYSLGFLPSFLLHAAAEIFLVLAVGCGRSLKNAECGVRGALRLAFGRIS